jgi:hypothetical protein
VATTKKNMQHLTSGEAEMLALTLNLTKGLLTRVRILCLFKSRYPVEDVLMTFAQHEVPCHVLLI